MKNSLEKSSAFLRYFLNSSRRSHCDLATNFASIASFSEAALFLPFLRIDSKMFPKDL
jgi:hypothetical protein